MKAPELSVGELLRLAIPSMVFVVLTNAYRSVDQYWVGEVSTEAQAAVGASVFILIALYSLFQLASAGASALIARATGANDPERRRVVLGAAIFTALIITVFLGFVGTVLAEPIATTVGLEGEPARLCGLYVKAICLTALPLALTPLVDQAWVSMGNTRLPMVLQGLSLAINIVLTPVLMLDQPFDWLPGLGLGIVGAAYASNASRLLSTGLGLWLLARHTGLKWSDIRPNVELPKVLKIGFPAFLGVFLYAAVYWVMLRTSISPLGPEVNAALGIGFSALEGVTWPCFYGVSIALGSLVGRSLGAGRPDQAKRAVKLAAPLLTFMGVLATLAFAFGGYFLTGLFTNDPEVHRQATLYASILAFSQVAVAWESLTEGALLGAGDTKTVTWLSVPFNLLRIPLAYTFAFPLGMGAAGVWWAINVSSWLKTGAKMVALFRGKWLELEI
ncbi:MAG: MATE family multidrug resistance protein [Cognaticolwellia sp.]|jgi:MATE family multidrug resistance protein